MHTLPLGSTGRDVSAVGFGEMPLSIQGRPDDPTGMRVIHSSLDAGITLIDTADVYCTSHLDIGHGERLVAHALKSWRGPAGSVLVATKGGMTRPDGRWERNGRPDHLRRACESSLQRLAVERIDLYQLHAPDPAVPFEESIGALADLQREGKIRWIGISNVSLPQLEAARALVDVVSVQNRLNPFFRESIREGVVRRCGELGIAFLAYSPVGGGRLNKKLPEHPVVRDIARRLGASPHAVVIAWVLAQGPSVIAIPGARTVAHAEDAARAAGLALAPDDRAAIDRAEFSTA